ncbi:BED-type domain-containing protein [Citrus sinensis]|nr:BED-type domain-containing protein [Citrus sinensis]
MSSSLPTPHLMDDEGNQTQSESAASVTHGGLRHRGRMRKMARAIVMHEYPLSIVEHQGLMDVMSSLNQLWKSVSRNTIKKEIVDIFLEVLGSQTGQVLCDKLMGSLLELNIERKLSSIIVDNAATNGRMIDFMLLALDKNDLILGGQKFHVRCCAHILNLTVKDGLSVIGDLIANIRESFIFWSGSPKRKSSFDENARKLVITSGRKPVQDCPTRWNSTYLMIYSALHYKNVFCRLKNIDGQYKCFPSEHDWQLASALENDLKCFYDCTTLFSGTSYPTSNLFLHYVCDIRLRLNEWVSTPTYDEFRIMAKKMIEKIDKHWHDMSEILSIACIFDPKFKIRLVEYCFSMIYGDDGTSRVHIVHGDCQSIVKEYKARYASADSSPSFVNVGNEEVKDEPDTYLGEKLVPFNVEEDFDVLSWWKVNGGNYPILSRIARDILAIPVTIVASESAFSTAVASSSLAYAKILDEEPEIETDVEAVEVYEES